MNVTVNIMILKNKIKSIFKGYRNLILKDEELEELFKTRLNICKSCENNIAGVCNQCGCLLAAKTRSLSEKCPQNYWAPVHRIDENGQFILKSELPLNLREYFPNEVIEMKDWLDFVEDKE